MTLVQIVARGEEPDGYLDSAPLCPHCRCLRDSDWVSPTYRVRNRHDSVYSGGGVLLVSQRFIEAVREQAVGDVGCRFEQLAVDPQYCALVVDRVLEVDRAVGELEVGGEVCPVCGRQSTYGWAERFIPPADDVREFARSDIEYGGIPTGPYPSAQRPRVYVDDDLGRALRALKVCQIRPLGR
jgi:hypothetical protein